MSTVYTLCVELFVSVGIMKILDFWLIDFFHSVNYPPTIFYFFEYCRGALQSVLILREYKECYDALVDALENGGSLGDCIYAIENAGREYNKEPLRIPLGYISEEGDKEVWTKVIPNNNQPKDVLEAAAGGNDISESNIKKEAINPDQSLETLREYKETLANKLKDINEKLEGL